MMEDEIPKSVLKYTTINADLSALGGKGEILSISPKCTVVGVGDNPFTMFATPDFDVTKLPPSVGAKVYGIKSLILQYTFREYLKDEDNYAEIPSWITDFKKIKELKLDHVIINDLSLLQSLSFENLILSDVKYKDDFDLHKELSKLKHLKYLAVDDSVSVTFKDAAKQLSPKLEVMSIEDYYTKNFFKEWLKEM